ncbi:hypothetical protein M501DRAFT_822209 [Patellaria atrata CBS 101060]|uniref:Uncharacterized protein n=1 Tax=Patellaria atrata CBS 101060 TaxID=1346257 RepID=A0A9P4VR98_9PEZI|nr:hypothetical protein M501DRAFT_822209 [Patellaria atrata CBS 101060]
MMKGGIAHPVALTHSIAVDHSRLPSCIRIARPMVSELVTTFDVADTPIMNPVSSKL